MAGGEPSGQGADAWAGHAFLGAARGGDVAAVEAALANTPSLAWFVHDNGHTPLHEAAVSGKADVVNVLLRAKAHVHTKDSRGNTPLHWAAYFDKADVADVLLRSNAEVDAKSNAGETPLHKAAVCGYPKVADVLLRANADVDARDKDGWTPLHMAAYNDKADVVEVLLRANADVDAATINGLTALRMAILSGAVRVVPVLLKWGSSIPYDLRPSPMRAALPGKARWRHKILDQTRPMTEQERQAAKDAWRMAVGATSAVGAAVAVVSAVDQSLVDLQAAYDGFVADPTALTVGALITALTPPRERDVRWHVRAHHLLLLAARVGVFAGESPTETVVRRIYWYRRVYTRTMGVVTPCDRHVVGAIVRDASEKGVLEPLHVSIIDTSLELHATFYAELMAFHKRLIDVEERADRTAKLLNEALDQLHTMRQYLVDKAAHDRKVALIKAAAKIAACLTPVVGNVLAVTIDVVAELSDGAAVATAFTAYMADPTDMAAARHVLSLVRDAEAKLTPAQGDELRAAMSPFESLAQLEERLGWAACELELPTVVDGDGVADATGDPAGGGEAGGMASNADSEGVAGTTGDTACGGEAGGTASDPDSDSLGDAKGAMRDAAADILVDEVDARRGGGASRLETPPAGVAPVPAPATAAAVGVVAPAPRPTDATFFTGAADWSTAELVDRLVAFVVRGDDAAKRKALEAVIRTAADTHSVTGVSIVETQAPREMAVCVLGEWGARYGLVAIVESFIVKAQAQQLAARR